MGPECNKTMNGHSEIGDSFLLDGTSYSKSGLLRFCSQQLHDTGLPEWKKDIFSFIALFLNPEVGEILQKSSGSTGDPKSFVLSREAMLQSARRTLGFFGLKEGERALLCLPVHYIAGKMMVVRALLGGLDLLLTEPSSRPLQDLQGTIDFAALVPLQVEESFLNRDPVDRISTLIVGGGELHPATRRKFLSMAHPAAWETFGMTETYTHFAVRRINGPGARDCFRLLEGVRIELDARGCMVVDVPGITPGPLLTSDLVEINKRGDGFRWLGRYDNLINSGGVKIIPELLEEQITASIGHDCLVLGEPDRRLGLRLVLLVEYAGDDPPVEQWTGLIRERVSTYERPRRIVTVPSLPRNASMKPDRTTSRKLLL
jgi:o-succinylbenzoate---CoA ligase